MCFCVVFVNVSPHTAQLPRDSIPWFRRMFFGKRNFFLPGYLLLGRGGTLRIWIWMWTWTGSKMMIQIQFKIGVWTEFECSTLIYVFPLAIVLSIVQNKPREWPYITYFDGTFVQLCRQPVIGIHKIHPLVFTKLWPTKPHDSISETCPVL